MLPGCCRTLLARHEICRLSKQEHGALCDGRSVLWADAAGDRVTFIFA
jgi:hypothetical protein